MASLRHLLLILCITQVAGCYNSFDGTGEVSEYQGSTALTIAELHSMHDQLMVRSFNEDVCIKGVVSATDKEGNLFKSFVMQSGGFAIEILEGLYDSYIRHPEGYEVTIELNGLYMSRSYGVLQIGVRASTVDSSLDYFAGEAIADKYVKRGGYIGEVGAVNYNISELNSALCGSLVMVSGVTLQRDDDTSIPLWGG